MRTEDKLIDYPRDFHDEKVIVKIEVTGRPSSGGRYIAEMVANNLRSAGLEVDVKWGLEGEPNPFSEQRRAEITESIIKNVRILVVETQARRGWDPNV